MTTLLEQLIDLLDHDANSWSEDCYTLNHKDGYRIWTSNGWPHFNLYSPYKSNLTLRERLKLAKAIKRWRNRPLPIATNNKLIGERGAELTYTTKGLV